MYRPLRLRALLAAVLALLAGACGSSGASTPAPATGGTAAGDALSGNLTVFAAASLTESFNEMGKAFEAEHPGVKVTFSYGASSDLATQLAQGAPADVFASADQANMRKVTDGGIVTATPTVFTHNLPRIIVGAGNPKKIATVADLARPDLAVVICAPEVPCGRYAAAIFTNAKVAVTPKSLEQNVKAVVTKVTAGEADAGIVYSTDVKAAGAKAAGVDIPKDVNVIADYPIAPVAKSANAAAARAFTDFAASPQGQRILDSYGFLSQPK